MSEFCMPSLGADMEAGTLVEWLVKPGDSVKRGEIVAVVESLKGAVEIEIFSDAVFESLLVQPGSEVPVGTPLALIRVPGEGMLEPAQPAAQEAGAELAVSEPLAETVSEPVSPEPAVAPGPAVDLTRLRISPAARRRALELGVPLTRLQGSGRGGAVSIEDVERCAAAISAQPEPAKAPARPVAEAPAKPVAEASAQPTPAEGMRIAIAAAMSRSKREIPHYYLGHQFDLTPALDWITAYNADQPITARLVYAVLLVKAVALALRQFPEFNGCWRENHFVPSEDIHVGVAISLRSGGLVAPALAHADQQSLAELMEAFRDLVNRARSGQLRASEMSNGTITLTSLGEQGVETVYPVIYPPQVAMIGFGSVLERPWVVAGEIRPRRLITVSLATAMLPAASLCSER